MSIDKKYIIIIIVFVLIAIITPFLFLRGGKDDVKSQLEDTEQVKKMDNFLSELNNDLRKDIENELDIKNLYYEMIDINNYMYYSEFAKLVNKTDEYLRECDSSFVKTYKEQGSMEATLLYVFPTEYVEFTRMEFLGNAKNEEYSEDGTDSLYYRGLLNLAELNHDKFLTEMETLLETYKFTSEKNQKIATLYSDINMLNEFKNTSSTEYFDSIKDPNAYFVEVMRLYIDDRYEFIYDKNSPMISDSSIIMISNSEELTLTKDTKDTLLKEIFDQYNTITGKVTVYKTKFTDQETLKEFTAYIVYDSDTWYRVYTIKTEETGLKTIGEYYTNKPKEEIRQPKV